MPNATVTVKPRDPWKCANCQELMYNVEVTANKKSPYANVRPIPGAPNPKYISGVGELCTLCWELYTNLTGSEHWNKLHQQFIDERLKHEQHLKRIRGETK